MFKYFSQILIEDLLFFLCVSPIHMQKVDSGLSDEICLLFHIYKTLLCNTIFNAPPPRPWEIFVITVRVHSTVGLVLKSD